MPTLLAAPTRASRETSLLIAVLADVEAAVAGSAHALPAGQLRAQCIAAITAIPDSQNDARTIAVACRLVEMVLQAGWVDQPASAELVQEGERVVKQGWRGLLVALLLTPSWQLTGMRLFEQTPLNLWRTVATASFRLPPALTGLGEADALAARQLNALQELVRLAQRNPGSAAVRDAAAVCLAQADCLALANAPAAFERLLRLRTALRAAVERSNPAPARPLALPRVDRRLRVGVVVAELSNTRGLRSVLPWCEFLDSARFQVIFYSAGEADLEWSDYLTVREIEFRRLIGEIADQAEQLRSDGLDVALFATRAAVAPAVLSGLIAARAAPLQLTIDEHGFMTEDPSADGALAEEQLSGGKPTGEHVLAVPATGVRLMPQMWRGTSFQSWTREGLGLPPEVPVFASAAPFALLSPEWADRAAEILAALPGARLLIHSAAPEDAGPEALGRICATLQPALNRHGVEAARLSISNEMLGGPAGSEALLGIADLYLDCFSPGDREGPQLALRAGIPILALGSGPAGAEAMRRLGFSECLAEDPAALVAVALALGRDQARRGSLAHKLAARLAEPSACWDPLAFGESAGARIEAAFDAVAAQDAGQAAAGPVLALARRPALPEGGWEEGAILLQSGLALEAIPRLAPWFAAAPFDSRLRPLYYSALIQGGQAGRAAEGLTAVAERRPLDAETWRLLARAQLWLGRRELATATLRTSLRLEPKHPETWKVLEELAQAGGHHDLADEVSRHRGTLAEGVAAGAAAELRKCLYFSPVGRGGKEFLARIVERFPADRFDFLVIAYDDTDFSELEGRVEVIRDRGQKWRLIKKYLTPAKVSAYEFVFMWDDDLDPTNFDPVAFVDILRRNDVDIAQPSLTPDSHSFHPITVAHPDPVGRLTNFVEIMCPVYSAKIWPSIYPYIEPDINELGWGYDLIPTGRKAIVDCMSVRHTRPGQSGQAGAAQQYAAWASRHGITRPALVNFRTLS